MAKLESSLRSVYAQCGLWHEVWLEAVSSAYASEDGAQRLIELQVAPEHEAVEAYLKARPELRHWAETHVRNDTCEAGIGELRDRRKRGTPAPISGQTEGYSALSKKREPKWPQVDGNGLPFPDQKTYARLASEGMNSPPHLAEWSCLVALLRHAAMLRKEDPSEGEFPPGMVTVFMSLQAVVAFLQQHPVLMNEDAVAPLTALLLAIDDLRSGTVSEMFKPPRKLGRPRIGHAEASVMGLAASTMSKLIKEEKLPKNQAAALVARALKARGKRFGDVGGNRVSSWRVHIQEGPVRIPAAAVEHYKRHMVSGMTGRQSLEFLGKVQNRVL
jgi:hypothetical protein